MGEILAKFWSNSQQLLKKKFLINAGFKYGKLNKICDCAICTTIKIKFLPDYVVEEW